MNVAFGNYTYALYTFEYFLNAMQRFDIQNIELWGAAPHFYIEDRSIIDAEVLGKKIRSKGFKVVCFTPEQCAYPINIASEDIALRKRSIAFFEKAINYATALYAPAVLITPGQGSRDLPILDAWNRSLEAVIHLAEFASRKGVVLYFEHLTQATTNLVVTMADMARYLNELNSPVVFPLIDLDMMAREGERVNDFLTAFNCMPEHVHLVDGLPGGHLVPGDGVLPLEEELMTLKNNGYKGFLTIEVMHERYLQNPDLAMEKCLRWLKNLCFLLSS